MSNSVRACFNDYDREKTLVAECDKEIIAALPA